MEEHKNETISLNVKKPPSKRSAHFDIAVKILESARELIQESDSDNNASNVFRNIQTLGEPSHCENLLSLEGSRVHEKASHTPSTLLQKPSDPVYHSAS